MEQRLNAISPQKTPLCQKPTRVAAPSLGLDLPGVIRRLL